MRRWFLNPAFRKNGYSQKRTYWAFHPTRQIWSHGIYQGCTNHGAMLLMQLIAYGGISYMRVLGMERASCHPSGALNFEKDSKFYKILCSLILSLGRWISLSSILTAWTRSMALSGAHHGNLLVIPWWNWGNFPIRMHLSLLALLRANRATKIHIIIQLTWSWATCWPVLVSHT